MAHFYAAEWIINKDDLTSNLTGFIDSAKTNNCDVIAVPLQTELGYKGQCFLIRASSLEHANLFMDNALKVMNIAPWFPITEEYFQEQLNNDGYPRPYLQQLKYAGTLNYNLSKLRDIWYEVALYNDRLKEQLDKNRPVKDA